MEQAAATSKAAPMVAVLSHDTVLRELLCELLTDEGYAPCCGPRLDAVLPWLMALRPAALVCDVGIVEVAAWAALFQALAEHTTLRKVGVVTCTANQQFLAEHALALNAMGAVVAKPFALNELADALVAVLHRSYQIRVLSAE